MTPKTTIRPYRKSDRASVIGIFRSNVPQFFTADEEESLCWTLDNPDGPHWVIDHAGALIGYGGFEIGETYNRVTLCWGMIDKAHHGRGFGRLLLAYRAGEAYRLAPDTADLVVDTTPDVAGFYRHCGFEEVENWPRGYRSGFNMIVLRLSFDSPEFQNLRDLDIRKKAL
jgi:GNAT superfamily N-acetyltransferase